MKQNFVIICESAIVAQDTKNLYILGIFGNISALALPAIHPKFAVVTNFEDGTEGDHDHKILIRHEDGSEIIQLPGKIHFGPNQKVNYIGSFVGLPFPKIGKYIVEIYVDNVIQPLTSSFNVEQK